MIKKRLTLQEKIKVNEEQAKKYKYFFDYKWYDIREKKYIQEKNIDFQELPELNSIRYVLSNTKKMLKQECSQGLPNTFSFSEFYFLLLKNHILKDNESERLNDTVTENTARIKIYNTQHRRKHKIHHRFCQFLLSDLGYKPLDLDIDSFELAPLFFPYKPYFYHCEVIDHDEAKFELRPKVVEALLSSDHTKY